MTAALIASFLNTGLLWLVIDANFAFAPYPFNLIPLWNKVTDIDKVFYNSIPKHIINTMIISAFMPWFGLTKSFLERKFYIWKDRGYPLRK